MSIPGLLFDRQGAAGIITLNRPEALNALSLEMILGIRRILAECRDNAEIQAIIFRGAGDRAFCAGGDIKAVYQAGVGESDPAKKAALAKLYFADEYHLNRDIFHYPKPTIAFMNGITMGGGFGIAGPCRFRVATEKTSFAMPEVGIGFFPDVGSMYFLTRAPEHMGHWLALTGDKINGANMIAFGLATHAMPEEGIEACLAELCRGVSPAVSLDKHHRKHSERNESLRMVTGIIEKAFSNKTVEEILKALDQPGHDFAARTAATMRLRSPTSLKLTHAYYQKMQGRSFDEVTAMDYRLSIRCVLHHDFYEGIRAAVVDKDRNPKWNPARLEDVADAAIVRYFADDLPDLDQVA